MNQLRILLTAAVAGALLLSAPLPAADFAEFGTASAVYEHGKIDSINLKDRYLVVDDGRYALAPDVRVNSATGETVPLNSLKRGMKVSFALQAQSGAGARTITELVIRSGK